MSFLLTPVQLDVRASHVERSTLTESTTTNAPSVHWWGTQCHEKREVTDCRDLNTGTKFQISNQDNMQSIEIVTAPPDGAEGLTSAADQFTPTDVLFYIDILNSETREGITQFQPAMEVRVPYNAHSVDGFGELDRLTVGWWNGLYWQVFSEVEIHGYLYRGFLYVELTDIEQLPPQSKGVLQGGSFWAIGGY